MLDAGTTATHLLWQSSRYVNAKIVPVALAMVDFTEANSLEPARVYS